MRKRKSGFVPGSDAYSISRALKAARERDETTIKTPEERARMAKFGATLVGARTPAFDEAGAQRQAAEESALQAASMSEEEILRDVVPSEVMQPETPGIAAPPELPPQQK